MYAFIRVSRRTLSGPPVQEPERAPPDLLLSGIMLVGRLGVRKDTGVQGCGV